MMNKLIVFVLGMFLLSFASAVTMENQTVMRETGTNSAYIQVEQDTSVSQLAVNETYGGIIFTDLQTFNSTYTNLNTTNPSQVKFELMDDVTVYYSNGTSVSYTGTDFDLEISIPANGAITLASDVPTAPPSTSITIKPDVTDTVPHIILGRNLIFTWISVLL